MVRCVALASYPGFRWKELRLATYLYLCYYLGTCAVQAHGGIVGLTITRDPTIDLTFESCSKLESDWSARARSQTYFGIEAEAELRLGLGLVTGIKGTSIANNTCEWVSKLYKSSTKLADFSVRTCITNF